MSHDFFEGTKDLRTEISASLLSCLDRVGLKEVRDILLQRQLASSHIKGVTCYHLHRGLGGTLSHQEVIDLAIAVEIYSTSMVLIDNLVDQHEKRDGRTTFLKEYGPEMTGLASVYAANLGLLKLSPHLPRFFNLSGLDGVAAVGEAITAAVSMDVTHPTNPEEILKNIVKVNGITLAFPLSLIASTAPISKDVLLEVMRYGTDTGTAFGLYEEVRDFFGQHGRERASEIQSGRTPYFIAEFGARDPTFNPEEYVGSEMDESSYLALLSRLRKGGSLKRVKRLIKNHLGYGSDALRRNLKEENFEVIDSLRQTIEKSLDELID